MRVLIAFLMLQFFSLSSYSNTGTYGRLFLTPQQRAALEDVRRHKVKEIPRPVKKAAVVVVQPKPQRPSGNVTLNGIVRRSDGESTIWVNGVAMPGDAQTGKVQVAPMSSQSGVVQIPHTDSSGRVELKVGQRLDMSNGQVSERYVNRARPPVALPSSKRTQRDWRTSPQTGSSPTRRPNRRSSSDDEES